MRVSGASAALVHDSLSVVNVPRRCCRPGCPHYAVATLTFVYSDSTAVIGPRRGIDLTSNRALSEVLDEGLELNSRK